MAKRKKQLVRKEEKRKNEHFISKHLESFFKIGAFTIGGGYAMVPLIENEIVTKRKWIAQEDFYRSAGYLPIRTGNFGSQYFYLYRI